MEPVKGGMLANPPDEALDIIESAGYDRTPVDWALQFLWDRPEVSVVLSGMGSQQMVDENCASADRSGIGSLSVEEEQIITDEAHVLHVHPAILEPDAISVDVADRLKLDLQKRIEIEPPHTV